MNKFHNIDNDFTIKCNTSEILDFSFIGHEIMGVAWWRNFLVKDSVSNSTMSKREKLIKLNSATSPKTTSPKKYVSGPLKTKYKQ